MPGDVILGYDGSDGSKKALAAAIELADALQRTLPWMEARPGTDILKAPVFSSRSTVP